MMETDLNREKEAFCYDLKCVMRKYDIKLWEEAVYTEEGGRLEYEFRGNHFWMSPREVVDMIHELGRASERGARKQRFVWEQEEAAREREIKERDIDNLAKKALDNMADMEDI